MALNMNGGTVGGNSIPHLQTTLLNLRENLQKTYFHMLARD